MTTKGIATTLNVRVFLLILIGKTLFFRKNKAKIRIRMGTNMYNKKSLTTFSCKIALIGKYNTPMLRKPNKNAFSVSPTLISLSGAAKEYNVKKMDKVTTSELCVKKLMMVNAANSKMYFDLGIENLRNKRS
jgi:hypothetical protein